MMYRRIHPSLVGAVLATVAALSAWMGYLRPERLLFYSCAGGFLPLAWGLLTLVTPRTHDADGPPPQDYSGALTLAGLLVGLSLGMRVATTLGAVDQTTAERAVGVAVGALLIVTGNALPKILTPLERLRCDPRRVQSFHRFAGWSFVLAGIAYAGLFLVLEPKAAAFWSSLVTGACVAVVAARLVILVARRADPPARGRAEAAHRLTRRE